MTQVMETVQLTPLEQLRSKKAQARLQSEIEKDKLSANLKYVQHNAGKLIVNGVTSAILPGKSNKNQSRPSSLPSTLADIAIGGAKTYFRSSKGGGMGILPLAWSLAQPFVLTWGIKGVKKLAGSLFSGKKKKNKKKK